MSREPNLPNSCTIISDTQRRERERDDFIIQTITRHLYLSNNTKHVNAFLQLVSCGVFNDSTKHFHDFIVHILASGFRFFYFATCEIWLQSCSNWYILVNCSKPNRKVLMTLNCKWTDRNLGPTNKFLNHFHTLPICASFLSRLKSAE